MNCFECQNQVSDFLDGTLPANLKQEADGHLESCEECSTRYKHYRLVLTSISNQPRSGLPASVRKAPLASPPRGKRGLFRDRVRNWSQAPWYVRIPLEGGGIALFISLVVSGAPKLRSFYERKVEKSLTEYNEGFDGADLTSEGANTQLARGNLTASGIGSEPSANPSANTGDDYSDSEGDSAQPKVTLVSDDTDASGGNDDEPTLVRATSWDTWRFNLKTDSPKDVRAKIEKILTDLHIPSNTPGIGGTEAPGGIQFDLVVSQSVVSDLKQALEKIAPPPPKDMADSPFGESFTWYKKRARTPVGPGKTHVVIWLAQI